jgi:predicted esterase
LILLHGLGDTHQSFHNLGQQLNLPETVCISLQGPKSLPFDVKGYHWGDDIIFDQPTGMMDMDAGFKDSVKLLLEDVIRNGLIETCEYKPREIIIFGYGQGAMLALQTVAENSEEEFGGVVSVGGPLPISTPMLEVGKKSRTPVLVCRAIKNSQVSDSSVKRLRDYFEFVEIKDWKKPSDAMPGNRDEMLPIMQFFARRLRSARGIPKGSIELS